MSGIILPRGLAVQPQSRAALDASYIPYFVWNGCTPNVDLVSGLIGRVINQASVDVARQKTTPLGRVISKQATSEYIDFARTTGPGSSFTVVLQFVATGATNNTVLFANRPFWSTYNGVFIGYANGAANNIQLAGSSAFANVATPGVDTQNVKHTLVVRFRGSVADVALDGRFCGTATGLGVPNSTWNGLGIGNYATTANSGGGLADFSLCAVLLSKNIDIVRLSLNPWKIFNRQQKGLWFDAAASAGTQTLTPALYTNSQTFYAPTVVPGTVALTAGLFTNSNTFYGHTLTTNYGLVASLFTNSPSFYAPTVSTGSVTLSATLFSNAATFYAPTVSQGAAPQALTPTLYSNAQTFYTPTVSAGSVALTATRLDNAQTFYASVVTISGGPQYLVPDLYSSSQTFYSPSVVPGTVTLTATRLDNAQTFYAHAVSQDGAGQTLTPLLFSSAQEFYAPSVSLGAATIIPALYANAHTFYAHTLTGGVSTYTRAPDGSGPNLLMPTTKRRASNNTQRPENLGGSRS